MTKWDSSLKLRSIINKNVQFSLSVGFDQVFMPNLECSAALKECGDNGYKNATFSRSVYQKLTLLHQVSKTNRISLYLRHFYTNFIAPGSARDTKGGGNGEFVFSDTMIFGKANLSAALSLGHNNARRAEYRFFNLIPSLAASYEATKKLKLMLSGGLEYAGYYKHLYNRLDNVLSAQIAANYKISSDHTLVFRFSYGENFGKTDAGDPAGQPKYNQFIGTVAYSFGYTK